MTPKTNNEGGKRTVFTADRIRKARQYYFNSAVIRKFMSPLEFNRFIKSYINNRGHRIYTPSSKEIKLFESYKAGKVKIDQFQKKLKLKTLQATYQKIGKLYDYTAKN